jgi:hypothetical protein
VLEENLRNGVVLAKLGNFIAPDAVPLNKIYDPNQERYDKFGLQFRHTDNINKWIHSLEAVKLPKVLQPLHSLFINIASQRNISYADFSPGDHRCLRQKEHASSHLLHSCPVISSLPTGQSARHG